jgi:hypothetical protein
MLKMSELGSGVKSNVRKGGQGSEPGGPDRQWEGYRDFFLCEEKPLRNIEQGV